MRRQHVTTPLIIPPDGAGLIVVASVSGGKDSTALILALLELVESCVLPLHLLRFVFADTGWEHADTYAYLDYLRERLEITIDVVRAKPKATALPLPDGWSAMVDRIRYRAGFPARMARWCTRELKIEPLRAYHDAMIETTGDETVSAMGIRADESASRSTMTEWADEPEGQRSWGGYVWRPLLRWTVGDVLAMHNRHGVKVNPRYHAGFNRVGCDPCIMENKEGIRQTDASRIDQIRDLEREMTELRATRNMDALAEDGELRYRHSLATFFQTRTAPERIVRPCSLDHDHDVNKSDCDSVIVPAKPMTIDDVVAWSKTDRGGASIQHLRARTEGRMRGLGNLRPAERN